MPALYPLYAFDNYFRDADRTYPLAEQMDLLKELGYAKIYLSIGLTNNEAWAGLLQLPGERRRTGVGLAAAYTVVKFGEAAGVPSAPAHTVDELLARLEPGDTLELAFSRGMKKDRSDPAYDDEVIGLLSPWLESARSRNITISLYHHFGFWQERIEDCVRIAAKVNDPALRVTFCGKHWYGCDGTDLAGKLRLAAPWLHSVNVCGSRYTAPRKFSTILPVTVEPVGDGDFPLAEFVAGLRAIDYRGEVGFQGFKVGGYPPLTLRRSLEAFRRAEQAC